ncbi:MAG: TerB N-terminal domain-containing protein [Burkholderiales bacterium]
MGILSGTMFWCCSPCELGEKVSAMARRKTSSAGRVIVGGIVGLLALLAAIPREVWIGVVVLTVIGVAFYVYAQLKKSQGSLDGQKSVQEPVRLVSNDAPRAARSRSNRGNAAVPARRFVEDDTPVSAAMASAPTTSDFRLPTAPKGFGAAAWIPAGQPVSVSGVTIPGGMIYVGTSLKTALGTNDPCLIDPSKSVASHGDYAERQFGYWPSYSEISSSARRAYLNWLADGRKDPEADIGYVFIFFYGLERRAIIDAAKDRAAQADWPAIAEENRRLLRIYGDKSNSFRRYASELLDWVSLAVHPLKLYEKPIPDFPKTFELPLYIRLALGQAAVQGVPVPAHLALAWVKLDPNTLMRTPAIRCGEQFEKLFTQKYVEVFGAGITLPRNRSKLKFVYRPASAGFRGTEELRLTFGDTPDVTVLMAPIKKLQHIVEAATKELEPYSRFVGRNTDATTALEGLLQLPATLWPESAQRSLQALKVRMGGGMVAMSFQELLASLEARSTLTKEKTLALARALESLNIGIEPDVLAGAKLPKPDEKVVLFAVPPAEVTSRATPAYQAAALTLQLASAVATADGKFGPKELVHLREQVQSWTHLTPNHTRRLLAQLRLLMATPVSLTIIKKKLEPLDTAARETIASFMATVAQSDGTVTPAEVKTLEKVYRALGVDSKKVFADVHAAASGRKPTPATVGKVEETGFKLDPARIAALQNDTEKVSALLAEIFKEDDLAAPAVSKSEVEAEYPDGPKGILGLDEPHTALARMLLSRPQWSREELLDVAADLELMLDGALERINESSLDAHDIAFVEGDDPMTVNAEILEKIEA